MTADYVPTELDEIERAESEKEKQARVAAKNAAEDIRWLMSNKRGRRVAWEWLSDAGVFRSTFNTNAMLMAFEEGKRSRGLKLMAHIVEVCPELYYDMTRENTK